MAETKPTTSAFSANPSSPWARRALPLAQQLARAERLLELHLDAPMLTEVRDVLAAVIQSHDRGELSSLHAESLATLASLALEATELMARVRAGGR